jgi:endo-1,3-1,4-beta-glycanase ExoK
MHFPLLRPWACPAVTLTLLLTAIAPAQAAKPYKGAEVYSREDVHYGRIEVRMRMIRGSSLLSTFFAYKDGSELAGAQWGEIDVEALGKNDAKSWQSNLITGNPRVTSEHVHTSPTSLADDYHTYQVEWTPEYVSWSFDGTEVRRTVGGQASELVNPHTLRFNVWSSEASGWAGDFDEGALPAYQFVNWIRYYSYDNGQFTLAWTDDFDTFDTKRWNRGKDGVLVLAITKEGAMGFSGDVPVDPQGNAGNAPVSASGPTTATAPADDKPDPVCSIAKTPSSGRAVASLAVFCLAALAGIRRARRRHGHPDHSS